MTWGRPAWRLPARDRSRIVGYVDQHYERALAPELTVRELVALPLELRGVPARAAARRVDALLERVGLGGRGDARRAELSGGEQQRVALARALVFRPRVLLMDEPLGALDKKLRAHMQLELKRIQRHVHVTVLYVTHDQEEALTMSDRIAVMRGGRVEQVGGPTELYEAPLNPFVADFLGESNFIDGVVVTTEGGRALVRADAGLEFWGVGATPLRAGERVTSAVRPEKLAPEEAPSPELNRCKGIVAEVVYAGDASRYRISLGAVGTMTVKLQNRRLSRQLAGGDPVELAWDPAHTRLFPASVAE